MSGAGSIIFIEQPTGCPYQSRQYDKDYIFFVLWGVVRAGTFVRYNVDAVDNITI